MPLINLAALARAAGYRRKEAVLRPVRPTLMAERKLAAIMRRVPAALTPVVNDLLTMYSQAVRDLKQEITAGDTMVHVRDDAAQIIETMKEQMERATVEVLARAEPDIHEFVVLVEEQHRRSIASAVSAGLGVDVFPYLNISQAAQEIALAEARNIDLITRLDQDTRNKLAGRFFDAFIRLKPRKELAKEVSEIIGSSKNRGLLIARDQTVKLSENLNQIRQQQMGLEVYVWRTSQDERVRPSHADKAGRRYKWNKPPADTGHPGHDINCRCTAQGVLTLDDEED